MGAAQWCRLCAVTEARSTKEREREAARKRAEEERLAAEAAIAAMLASL